MFRSILTTIPAVLVLFAISGCKTTGQQSTAYQLESIKQLRTSLDTGSKQINSTVGALEQLAATTTGDLRPAYQKFTTELAKLDSDTATARSRSESMKTRAKEHLELWENETRSTITNPELRKISEEQRAQAKERFEELQRTTETGKDAYQKLSSNLHEIQKILDMNLSSAGIDAIKPVVLETKSDAKTVQDAITAVVGKLDNVTKALSPTTGGAPVPASGPEAPPTTSNP